MFLRWLQAVVLLPGTVLLVIPVLILHYTMGSSVSETIVPAGSPRFLLAVIASVPGLVLGGWTMLLFIRFGDGTAAPWDPPQNLVVRGPYRHVRNPMISGVLFLLIAESLLFESLGLLTWTMGFSSATPFTFHWSKNPVYENGSARITRTTFRMLDGGSQD